MSEGEAVIYDSARFRAMFRALAVRLEREKAYLCELDGQIGDADHGIAMAQGFAAAAKAIDDVDLTATAPSEIFNIAARSFLNAVGASCGPLYATGFMRAGAALKGKADIGAKDVVAVLSAIATGIGERGRAVVGDKTMIDAWVPAVAALTETYWQTGDLAAALRVAAAHAQAGMEATRDMIAAKGRSARLGERARGHIDPGAASAAIVIAVIAESLSA